MKRLLSKLYRTLLAKKLAEPPSIGADLSAISDRIREQKLTFLSMRSLYSLVSIVGELERSNLQGSVIEAGCALGGSAIAMCAAKNPDRKMELYDTFEMIPPPSEKDDADVHERYETIRSGKAEGIDGGVYYGYLEDIPQRVEASFSDFGQPIDKNHVTLHKGLLQDTLDVNGPVVMAHIDVDWYDPVYVCLERIVPHLVPGGAIILDDYFAWSGCRKATDEFFAKRKREFSFCSKFGHMIVRPNAS